jgi:glycopeptide antibiotics resistance protein
VPGRILDRVAAYLADFALFWPGVVVSVVIAAVLDRHVARRLGTGRPVAWLLLFAVGLIVAATLTPSREALLEGLQGSGTCDTGRIGPAPFGEIVRLRDAAFNIALFIPLGISIGALPRGAPRAWLLLGAVVSPPAIELTQLLVRPLDRACQTADIVDNLTGLAVGLVIGWLVARAIARRRADRVADPR